MARHHHVARCPIDGLFCWLTRKDARGGAQDLFPGQHLAPYRCGGYWHVGTLPVNVVQGRATRDGQPVTQPAGEIVPNPAGAAQIRAMWKTMTAARTA